MPVRRSLAMNQVGRRKARGRNRRKKFKNYSGMKSFKLRYPVALTTDGAGQYTTRFSQTNLGGGIVNGTSGTAIDWTELAALFDSYRVTRVTLKYFPKFPNNVSASTAYFPIYYVSDPDNGIALTSISDALQYDNVKVRNLYKPHSVSYNVKKVYAANAGGIVMQGGFLDIATSPNTGYIKMYSTALSVGLTYGEFMLEFSVDFKYRR